MLINLISQSNYQSYNVEIASILGLESAVYLNALIEINEKAIRKNKLINDHFLIDRTYIKNRTTLSISQQKNIEKTLEELKIIHKNNDDCIKVNIDILSGIMMSSEESIVQDLSFLKNKSDKSTKGLNILKAVKTHINENYPDELKTAYEDWLDVVYNKFSFVSKQMLINAQKVVDKEANHDLNVAIDIIHIASGNGWKDMEYAVKIYKQRVDKGLTAKPNNINVSREGF